MTRRRPRIGLAVIAAIGLFALTACTRPLSENEARLAETMFGEEIDVGRIRVAEGLGITPPTARSVGSVRMVDPPEEACIRTPARGARPPPRAFAIGNRIHLTAEVFSQDMMYGWPEALRVPHGLIMAHELVHVWQWQNRGVTGYRPWRAASESFSEADPYFYGQTGDFARLGFEQQAALLEDWLCFSLVAPEHPRRRELAETLAPVFPLGEIEAAIGLE